jgi:hypothetical protein
MSGEAYQFPESLLNIVGENWDYGIYLLEGKGYRRGYSKRGGVEVMKKMKIPEAGKLQGNAQ